MDCSGALCHLRHVLKAPGVGEAAMSMRALHRPELSVRDNAEEKDRR